VYRFRDARGRVLYLGRAGDLPSRVRSYVGPLQERPHLRRMARRIATAEHRVNRSEHEAAFLERHLLERSCPPFNRIEGNEVLAYLRYADATGLAFAREPRDDGASYFGPYLGSNAARLAADALNFIFPVALAVGGRTIARELARSRGLGAP